MAASYNNFQLAQGSLYGYSLSIDLRRIYVLMRPFPSSPGPLFQNEGRCSAFDMEIISHSHANKSHFHKKGCAPNLILKVRVFGTRKWPIILRFGGFSSTGTNPTSPWC